MDHIHRAIEKQKQPLPGDQPQQQQQQAAPPAPQQQQAAPAQQPAPEDHHHGKQVAGGLAKAGEFGFGASIGSAAANSVMGAFKG